MSSILSKLLEHLMTTLQKHMQDNLNICKDKDNKHKEGIKCGITLSRTRFGY